MHQRWWPRSTTAGAPDSSGRSSTWSGASSTRPGARARCTNTWPSRRGRRARPFPALPLSLSLCFSCLFRPLVWRLALPLALCWALSLAKLIVPGDAPPSFPNVQGPPCHRRPGCGRMRHGQVSPPLASAPGAGPSRSTLPALPPLGATRFNYFLNVRAHTGHVPHRTTVPTTLRVAHGLGPGHNMHVRNHTWLPALRLVLTEQPRTCVCRVRCRGTHSPFVEANPAK